MKNPIKSIILICLLIFEALPSSGQFCTTLGQNPTTAFPVCGKTVFQQNSVAICGTRTLPTLCNDNTPYTDKNPYWYKFTCYTAGKLGFLITPTDLTDDYDWQLFDVTGVDEMDVYTNKNLIISANWSGSSGTTGASSGGKNPFECSSDPAWNIPTFSTMPDLIAGHNYLLMVSHYTNTQSGYTLSFQGGSASIINPLAPTIQNAYAVCDGTEMVITLNKKMKCSSLAADGSDFSVAGPFANAFNAAIGKGCAVSFDFDTVMLKLNNVLSPGLYSVIAKNGIDGNTLIDNCDNQLALGLKKDLLFTASVPTPMDSISPVICIQDSLHLIFSKPMSCASIAPDGSDFSITGPSNVQIKSATGLCNNGISSTIHLVLQKPIKTNGIYTLKLGIGTDGNSLIDECGQITAAGSSLNFSIQNVVTADFNATIKAGCKKDTILLSHNGNNAANSWKWQLDNGLSSNLQNPLFTTNLFGKTNILLETSNGICKDSTSMELDLPDWTLKAGINIPDTVCSKDTVQILDASTANAITWKWDLGNGQSSTLQNPPSTSYLPSGRQTQFFVRLQISNGFNCTDTISKRIFVLPNCYIDIPSGFTPNGDGLNDFLYPLNAFKAVDLIFRIYNRFGQVIFETRDWKKKWDGRINGMLQPSGTYVYLLEYTHKDTGKRQVLKGTTVLIR
ncbi:MAG: PKD domain-containing protein [Chitinophagaceae bacterium BSSC1]|nr:MAG: PKD domain-containing protein [Chitinophagaceae bacterium BSSC1]